jgi:NTE family protein/lysophospholipid hydrolase
LEDEFELIHLIEGRILLQQGDPSQVLYVLLQGRLGVKIRNPDGTETGIDELYPGDSVGEIELLTGHECVATVYGMADSELLRLSRTGFDILADKYPDIINEFAKTVLPKLQRSRLASLLSDLFGELDARALHDLQDKLEWIYLRGGEVLFRQDDPGSAIYIVVQGRLRIIIQQPDGSTRLVGEAGTGESVGETALLTDAVHSKTVYAVRDTDVVRISRPLLEDLLPRYPQMLRQITHLFAQRERRTLRSLSTTPAAMTMVLVPLDETVPLDIFGQRFIEILLASGSTLHLSAQRFDQAYGKTGMAQIPQEHVLNMALVAWLSEQEQEYRYIVYEADPVWSQWTQRCLRHADLVLLLGRGDADPGIQQIERAIQHAIPKARKELVLLQPDQTKWPQGTSSWLSQRHVQAHHHLRINNPRDLRRLVRRVTGQALGLVLSGGGARGFGHVGAIRALEEAGLEVDLVGGTSMGALVGGAYALGLGYEGMVELANTFASPKELFDLTLPLVSFFRTKKVTHMLLEMARNVHMEDLWLPLFCVSCNLSQGQEVLHQTGLLWSAIRASLAIPGVFSPVLKDAMCLSMEA